MSKQSIGEAGKRSGAGEPAPGSGNAAPDKNYTPRKMTARESVVFSIKLFVGAALLIALLWYLNSHV
jgi:hypothetical protein